MHKGAADVTLCLVEDPSAAERNKLRKQSLMKSLESLEERTIVNETTHRNLLPKQREYMKAINNVLRCA